MVQENKNKCCRLVKKTTNSLVCNLASRDYNTSNNEKSQTRTQTCDKIPIPIRAFDIFIVSDYRSLISDNGISDQGP